MGVFYGVLSDYIVIGNFNNIVYGGDFFGIFCEGMNGFFGGIINVGFLLGNVNLIIDLRNYNCEFKLFLGMFILGGVFYNGIINLGIDDFNIIMLNIYIKLGLDVLNGAVIYGDGVWMFLYIKSGKIIMNI